MVPGLVLVEDTSLCYNALVHTTPKYGPLWTHYQPHYYTSLLFRTPQYTELTTLPYTMATHYTLDLHCIYVLGGYGCKASFVL